MKTNFYNKYTLSTFFLALFLIVFSSKNYAQNEQDYELVSIEFEGDVIFPEIELQKTIISKESPNSFSQFLNSFTSFGSEAIYFNPAFINSDIRRLQAFYKDRGYFKAKISTDIFVDSTDNDTELIFKIDAGNPAIVSEFKLTGLENIYTDFIEMIDDRITLQKGEQYSADVVNDTRAIVLNFLGDRGYMNVNSRAPEILVDTLKNEVEIKLDFDPGKRLTINELRLSRKGEGKDEVDDNLLLDLIDISPGDFFSNEKIQLSQVRLYRTNLFNSALILPVRNDTINNTVPLEILTNIGKIHQIGPELILNNENKETNVGLALKYTKRNFLGGARKLTTSFSIASTDPLKYLKTIGVQDSLRGYFDARISLEQPQFFGKPINTVFESYLTSRKRDDESDALLYGGSVRFNFDLPRFTYVTSMSTYMNFEHEDINYDLSFVREIFISHLKNANTNPDTSKIEQEVDRYMNSEFDSKSKSDNFLFGINIGMNNTNDQQLIFPTKGNNFQILFEAGNTFNPILKKILNTKSALPEYYKIQISSSVYFPMFNLQRSAFAFKFKSGIIHAYQGNKFNIPLNQRFYSGGSNSIRGWESRKLKAKQPIPLLSDINNLTFNDFDLIYNQGIKPGGFFMLEASAEARIHLFGDFGSAFFLDVGNNWDEPQDFNFKDVAVAAGFGFRYYSPFAPIRVDFAIKIWDPQEAKNLFDFSNWLGDTVKLQIGIGEAF